MLRINLVIQDNKVKFQLEDSSTTATVLRPDLIASNGIVHVVDRLFDKPSPDNGTKKVGKMMRCSSNTFVTLTHEYNPGAAIMIRGI